MIEPLAVATAANAIYDVGSTGIKEVKDILSEDQFEDDLARLEGDFEDALKDYLSVALENTTCIEAQAVEENWDTIVDELDSLDAIFDSRTEVIQQITTAAVQGLNRDFNEEGNLREEIDTVG